MTYRKAHKEPKPKIVVGQKGSSGKVATMPVTVPLIVPLKDSIRERAYELYQSRDCEPGQDVQDWLSTEEDVSRQER